jgi:hypothetical protein
MTRRIVVASAALVAALLAMAGGGASAKDKACKDGGQRLPITQMCQRH